MKNTNGFLIGVFLSLSINCIAVTPATFSGKPNFAGTIKDLYYSKNASCGYVGIQILNSADNSIIEMALPVSGGTWTGASFMTDLDVSREFSLLLTAKSTGSIVRGAVGIETSSQWARCGDSFAFYVPQYFLIP